MPLYPILPFILLIVMNHMPLYRHLLLPLFVIVSSLDTGSYIVGSAFGRHKIYPLISPSKTWEGFFGGYLIACISFSFLLWEQGRFTQPMWVVFLFTLAVSLLSLCGDLFESFLKRRARIKDSGSILPGHGGFLDRFDGILFAAVFFFLFRSYLARLF
jgi:phosphatidate cytidylyltransferase